MVGLANLSSFFPQKKIINSKNEICTEANFVLAFFDLEARKILNPTPEWLHAVGVKFE